ncbi:SAM-dependent methyltransferase, MidA family [Persephonella hydrogeniphila]|uniref:SAM-dependent methyltransferase, MidA family n=1 Tax=Persephonella hydrogeniphila TaxID=198703 RepID=A0A285NA47_9AQUI|nr:SAM-dependent methyltransferase [Persephonella hydrogeniphila]SNZ06309.1 SAM-dependent methyltransferase, MidA family [Persephonella hydrogeniphila]
MKITGKKELISVIKDRIKREGEISFRDFMDMALYYPELGYYTSPQEKIGGFGDFYTASELDRAFGELIGKQFVEIYEKVKENPFQIVEIGAGKGYLAYDILNFLKKEHPEVYGNTEYIIIEKSPYHIKIQKEILSDFEIVRWVQDIIDFEDESINGVIFSNELFDAFPVHLIRKVKGKIFEVFITIDEEDNIREILKEASEDILRYIKELNLQIPEGMQTEINLDASEYIQKIGKKLKKGYVITVDYGYPSSELYKPYRMRGTLLCYYRHRYSENFYENVGMQDITSHVNFSALKYYGMLAGLDFTGFTDQAHFLTNLGLMEILQELQEKNDYESFERLNRLKTLVLPKGMGEKFKVLVQHKNIDNPSIKGLDMLPYMSDRYRL